LKPVYKPLKDMLTSHRRSNNG